MRTVASMIHHMSVSLVYDLSGKLPFPKTSRKLKCGEWGGHSFGPLRSTQPTIIYPVEHELRINNLFLVLLSQTGTVAAMSVQEYFPEIGNDLTVVTWGHAVNSQQQLQAALTGKKIP